MRLARRRGETPAPARGDGSATTSRCKSGQRHHGANQLPFRHVLRRPGSGNVKKEQTDFGRPQRHLRCSSVSTSLLRHPMVTARTARNLSQIRPPGLYSDVARREDRTGSMSCVVSLGVFFMASDPQPASATKGFGAAHERFLRFPFIALQSQCRNWSTSVWVKAHITTRSTNRKESECPRQYCAFEM